MKWSGLTELKDQVRGAGAEIPGAPVPAARFPLERTSPPPAPAPAGTPPEDPRALFQDGLQLVRLAMAGSRGRHWTLEPERLLAWVRKARASLKADVNPWLTFVLADRQDLAIYQNAVGTAVLGLMMASELGASEEEADRLGVAALLHDLGMFPLWHADLLPRALTAEEQARVVKHPEDGAWLISRLHWPGNMGQAMTLAVWEEHERVNGQGYPRRLKGKDIQPAAKILAVADTMESLTHQRAFRAALPPSAALRRVTGERTAYDEDALRALLSVVTPYPPGSLVRLTTGAHARVLRVNPGLITRPVVQLDPAQPPLDLSELTSLSVTALVEPPHGI